MDEQIQFEEPEYARSAALEKHSWLAGLVIKTGLAKDDLGAQKVLLIALVLIIVATIAVFWMSSNSSSQTPPSFPLGVPSATAQPQ